jgi:Protein of unknown function (DUF3592)
MFYTNMKNKAKAFLANYESKDAATTAAAYEAIGGLLILDGFMGMPHPLSGKKRTSIFGNLIGILFGIALLFAPAIYSHSAQAKMTSTTTGTVTEVSQPVVNTTRNSNGSTSTSSTCSITAKYTVNSQEYTQTSASSSSGDCALIKGDTITVNYNPNNPGSWDYNISGLKSIVKYFVWVGAVVIVFSSIGFLFRLFTIWFGWRLLQRGRGLAKTLPNGGNLASMISQIKTEFSKNIFGV